jgi:hypothetical protein
MEKSLACKIFYKIFSKIFFRSGVTELCIIGFVLSKSKIYFSEDRSHSCPCDHKGSFILSKSFSEMKNIFRSQVTTKLCVIGFFLSKSFSEMKNIFQKTGHKAALLIRRAALSFPKVFRDWSSEKYFV